MFASRVASIPSVRELAAQGKAVLWISWSGEASCPEPRFSTDKELGIPSMANASIHGYRAAVALEDCI
jgi:hypothetical protein